MSKFELCTLLHAHVHSEPFGEIVKTCFIHQVGTVTFQTAIYDDIKGEDIHNRFVKTEQWAWKSVKVICKNYGVEIER